MQFDISSPRHRIAVYLVKNPLLQHRLPRLAKLSRQIFTNELQVRSAWDLLGKHVAVIDSETLLIDDESPVDFHIRIFNYFKNLK